MSSQEAACEESMSGQNAARGNAGRVDEQSMPGQNVARGSTGGVDEQSMVVSVANHASPDAPPGWGVTVLPFHGSKIRIVNISKSDFAMKAFPRNPRHRNPPTQVHCWVLFWDPKRGTEQGFTSFSSTVPVAVLKARYVISDTRMHEAPHAHVILKDGKPHAY